MPRVFKKTDGRFYVIPQSTDPHEDLVKAFRQGNVEFDAFCIKLPSGFDTTQEAEKASKTLSEWYQKVRAAS